MEVPLAKEFLNVRVEQNGEITEPDLFTNIVIGLRYRMGFIDKKLEMKFKMLLDDIDTIMIDGEEMQVVN